MANVRCARCGSDAPGLDRAPIPGPVGRTVLERTCASCWKEWLGMQVKYINEYRLSPLDPKHFEFLVEQAKAFLSLDRE